MQPMGSTGAVLKHRRRASSGAGAATLRRRATTSASATATTARIAISALAAATLTAACTGSRTTTGSDRQGPRAAVLAAGTATPVQIGDGWQCPLGVGVMVLAGPVDL